MFQINIPIITNKWIHELYLKVLYVSVTFVLWSVFVFAFSGLFWSAFLVELPTLVFKLGFSTALVISKTGVEECCVVGGGGGVVEGGEYINDNDN